MKAGEKLGRVALPPMGKRPASLLAGGVGVRKPSEVCRMVKGRLPFWAKTLLVSVARSDREGGR